MEQVQPSAAVMASAATTPQEASELDLRLQRIEAGVQEVRQMLDKERKKELESKKKNSRSTVTLAFALIGMKIGGAIASKSVLFGETANELRKKKGEIFENFKTETANMSTHDTMMLGFKKVFELLDNDFLKRVGMKVLIGSGIGALIGAIIGWTRGDRINDVHDLLKHPLDSLAKIIGLKPKEPPKPDELAATSKDSLQKAQTTIDTAQQQVSENRGENKREWQGKITAQEERQAATPLSLTLH